jgi:hypothetical protein
MFSGEAAPGFIGGRSDSRGGGAFLIAAVSDSGVLIRNTAGKLITRSLILVSVLLQRIYSADICANSQATNRTVRRVCGGFGGIAGFEEHAGA